MDPNFHDVQQNIEVFKGRNINPTNGRGALINENYLNQLLGVSR